MRRVRLGIGGGVLLALHMVLLAGVDLGHPHWLVTANTLVQQQAQQAPAVARPWRGPSRTVACLALLAGLLLVGATALASWRRRQPLAVTPPAVPVPTPPTPPPAPWVPPSAGRGAASGAWCGCMLAREGS